MSERTTRGLRALGASVVLGLLGDWLLRASPWGINLPLWMLGLIAAWAALRPKEAMGASSARPVLMAMLFLCAALFAWRDSFTLRCLDFWTLVLVFCLSALSAERGPLAVSLTRTLQGAATAGLSSSVGLFALLGQDIQWQEIPRDGGVRQASAIGRGLILACPLLIVFGSLLASADPVFAHGLSGLVRTDPADLAADLLVTAAAASFAAGWLRQALQQPTFGPEMLVRPNVTVGLTETAVVLGALNLLFAAFVLVQFRFFFGGAAYVKAVTGLTYSQYARGGFFELAMVSALVLPLLLTLHHRLRRETGREESVFRALAGTQIALLGVIMASAFRRMALYQAAYGQTELRFYVTAFMIWLGVLFVGLVVTVLRGRPDRFAVFGVFSGLLAVFVLNAVNPDAWIVNTNLARMREGKHFDAAYAVSLSADAVPRLAAALPTLPPDTQAAVRAGFAAVRPVYALGDWRCWNWGRAAAVRAIRQAGG